MNSQRPFLWQRLYVISLYIQVPAGVWQSMTYSLKRVSDKVTDPAKKKQEKPKDDDKKSQDDKKSRGGKKRNGGK